MSYVHMNVILCFSCCMRAFHACGGLLFLPVARHFEGAWTSEGRKSVFCALVLDLFKAARLFLFFFLGFFFFFVFLVSVCFFFGGFFFFFFFFFCFVLFCFALKSRRAVIEFSLGLLGVSCRRTFATREF